MFMETSVSIQKSYLLTQHPAVLESTWTLCGGVRPLSQRGAGAATHVGSLPAHNMHAR